MNESIYFNVDEIHNGISQNRKIQFKYFEYTIEKTRHFRKDGKFYVVSPYALTWDDENYYLVAYDSEAGIIKHYRVDKMTEISTTDQERDGKDAFESLDMAVYARKVFGMFSGEEVAVKLRFENRLVGAVLDRLGHDVVLVADGDAHFTVRANVVVSPQFLHGYPALAQLHRSSPQMKSSEQWLHISGPWLDNTNTLILIMNDERRIAEWILKP